MKQVAEGETGFHAGRVDMRASAASTDRSGMAYAATGLWLRSSKRSVPRFLSLESIHVSNQYVVTYSSG